MGQLNLQFMEYLFKNIVCRFFFFHPMSIMKWHDWNLYTAISSIHKAYNK